MRESFLKTYIFVCKFHSFVSHDGEGSVGMLPRSLGFDATLGRVTSFDVFGVRHASSLVVESSHQFRVSVFEFA